ncbi:MAG: precorrin-6y C5,15-methyltransferase (decarboxylating) subunit CbiE [Oscillospiraceae bacterium]|jgi:precorrin-6Y C5,15-methyltransferase (decarboxylating)|nr:precorrin-6y C5,15-methyltransferase (decarboxylating) subunit CbiE [Oscillospiraceae bacterium]
MQVTLAALGGGTPETMTAGCTAALEQAGCVIGAKRLLEQLPRGCTENRIAAIKPEAILDEILRQNTDCAVVYSGDTGFYSGARGLLPLLEKAGIPARVLPGVSSVQLLSARLGQPWQDWNLVSAHGTECSVLAAVSAGRPAFFLTGGVLGPAEICRRLTEAGLGTLPVVIGERLSYPDEAITAGTARELAAGTYAPLSVLLAEAAPREKRRCPGFPDNAFLRGDVPMTKQEVRAAALAKLAAEPADTLWDVGAGTGSVSVELALAAPEGQTFAVERKPEACGLIRANREKFSAWNLQLIAGRAPDALRELPPPDGVFIGGTQGGMAEIVDIILQKNANARICVTAIALETLSAAVAALTEHGLSAHVTQIAVSRSKPAGKLHLLTANNPIFLITGNCDA